MSALLFCKPTVTMMRPRAVTRLRLRRRGCSWDCRGSRGCDDSSFWSTSTAAGHRRMGRVVTTERVVVPTRHLRVVAPQLIEEGDGGGRVVEDCIVLLWPSKGESNNNNNNTKDPAPVRIFQKLRPSFRRRYAGLHTDTLNPRPFAAKSKNTRPLPVSLGLSPNTCLTRMTSQPHPSALRPHQVSVAVFAATASPREARVPRDMRSESD